ncbi:MULTISPECIES: RecQ family ATP-dependent DNA helicase [Bacillaceae]|jgi:ATP-dependent DNA helicase RecQ|uniref:ATP-dependent DNA helicase RecQ n=1 Tax=Cytobacillus firmus TaxID=1399 RepID=A0AA46PX08_CYTFI|nr:MULTISPECIES: ATP-dependent DNA helicase RecQ [Bacillaceae]KML46182.1 ATP-dependent DNA helicase [Cytobacillus firmus]MCC3647837.1 ATP-dependent DNA helicase RecQ [Cytobacillus oceanisediminis]MCS0654065.1 ATP-dependent DNA helicase [Cytobacillus firmus]MCU1805743.1 ATP-dependent DNA helicase [Cytobacillus firmus]URT69633.1 ATP-dependent DNA helicase [Cytobacillus firmus]
MRLDELLERKFGYSAFRPGQKEIIESVLAGRNTVAMLPTGTGKSLCYQLPGYMIEGQVIIISPLLSLMQDQAEQLMMNGEKKVIAFNSFLSRSEKKQALTNLDQYKFIFISPEMLYFESVQSQLKKLRIALFVVDEAHCISQWGYDFRPDYLKLGEVRQKVGNPVTLALTATATHEVKSDIKKSLGILDCSEIIYSVDRPNIALTVEKAENFRVKTKRLVELAESLEGPGIIYFSSKKMAEQTADMLRVNGAKRVMAYHGGMDQESRILVQQQFIHGQLDLICATSAFGMGINKENIRYVIHFHMPLQIESYLQEIGRAGRDGKQSIAIMLYTPGDEQLPIQIAENEFPDKSQIDWISGWMEENPNALTNISAYEEQIKQCSGLTEIQWRIFYDFFERKAKSGLGYKRILQEMNGYCEGRIKLKRNSIEEVYRWIHNKNCRRENILSFFDEEKNTPVQYCCDICGLQFDEFIRNTKSDNQDSMLYDWKNHLEYLLIPSE